MPTNEEVTGFNHCPIENNENPTSEPTDLNAISEGVPTDCHRPQTLGEYRVGIDFNVSGSDDVLYFKATTAGLIDHLKSLQDKCDNPEAKRAFAEAMTNYENAAMWAVKAVTKKPMPEHLKK